MFMYSGINVFAYCVCKAVRVFTRYPVMNGKSCMSKNVALASVRKSIDVFYFPKCSS